LPWTGTVADMRYRDRRRRRPPRYSRGNDSCWRDACLLETGCCIGEAISDNCLLATILLLPQFAAAMRAGGARARRRPGVGALVGAIEVYQREISAHRPPCCRFSPSCSHYAVDALRTHGVGRGLLLTARRLARCRPGGRRGPDPVPPIRNRAARRPASSGSS